MRLINKFLVSTKFQRNVNRRKLSRMFGWISDSKRPRMLLRTAIKKYVRGFKINMEEYEFDINTCIRFNDFFSRKFKPGMRIIGQGLVSPVEGFVAAFGNMASGMLYQVKGSEYSFDDLVGEKTDFEKHSSYLTIYLSPANYHRIHAPFDLTIEEIRYIPGTLFSTSWGTLEKEKCIYCRNERIVIKGNSEYGRFFFILVGAIVVGRIRLSFDELVTNKKQKDRKEKKYTPPLTMLKGEELGWFELGSTVVLALDSHILAGLNREINSPILFGETIYHA